MPLTLETLREQLTATELELEQAKAHVYRADGSIQLLRYLISEAAKPETPSKDETPASA